MIFAHIVSRAKPVFGAQTGKRNVNEAIAQVAIDERQQQGQTSKKQRQPRKRASGSSDGVKTKQPTKRRRASDANASTSGESPVSVVDTGGPKPKACKARSRILKRMSSNKSSV